VRKIFFYLTLIVFLVGFVVVGCQSKDKKVESAESKLQNAELNYRKALKNFEETKKDSLSDFELFKNDVERSILAYEISIAKYKKENENGRTLNKVENQAKMAELEQKVEVLKEKLVNYKDDEHDKWDMFRSEFVRDMEELGKALRDFTIKNNF